MNLVRFLKIVLEQSKVESNHEKYKNVERYNYLLKNLYLQISDQFMPVLNLRIKKMFILSPFAIRISLKRHMISAIQGSFKCVVIMVCASESIISSLLHKLIEI